MIVNCNVCDMPPETREALVEKSEELQAKFSIAYWSAKEPPPAKDFLLACEHITSLTGLVIKLLEDE